MAQLTAELENKKWTSKTKSSSFKKTITPREKDIDYKTENGIRADQKRYSTAGEKVANTDLTIESGSWKIVDSIYSGEKVKVLECVSSGTVNILVNRFRQSPTDFAYGEWEFIVSKADANNLVLSISQEIAGTTTQTLTYNFLYNTSEEIDFRTAGTVLIDGGATTYPINTFHKVKITRTTAGVFALYFNDTLIGTVTNATHTSANYLRIDIDTGDKIILSSERGTYGIIKK
jgi:hypothetical protein